MLHGHATFWRQNSVMNGHSYKLETCTVTRAEFSGSLGQIDLIWRSFRRCNDHRNKKLVKGSVTSTVGLRFYAVRPSFDIKSHSNRIEWESNSFMARSATTYRNSELMSRSCVYAVRLNRICSTC